MLETSRVEIDELPASIPWIVFDKARAVVKHFHTRSVASQFYGGKALNSLGWLKDYIVGGLEAEAISTDYRGASKVETIEVLLPR